MALLKAETVGSGTHLNKTAAYKNDIAATGWLPKTTQNCQSRRSPPGWNEATSHTCKLFVIRDMSTSLTKTFPN